MSLQNTSELQIAGVQLRYPHRCLCKIGGKASCFLIKLKNLKCNV